jgi:hypothetical protein
MLHASPYCFSNKHDMPVSLGKKNLDLFFFLRFLHAGPDDRNATKRFIQEHFSSSAGPAPNLSEVRSRPASLQI